MACSFRRAGAMISMAACAAATTGANADPMTFDFSGFGTAGIAWSDTNDAQFVREIQTRGVDSSGDISLDSLLGVQGTVHLTSTLSGTVQLMLRRTTGASYSLDPTLAFVKDQLTPDFSMRVGRLQLPVFMVSEYREIGFANTLVRPPQEVYGQVPLDYFDGVDGQYSHSFGPIDISAGVYYGRADVSVSLATGSATVALRKLGGANINATYGPLTLHYAREENHITATSALNTLISGIGAAGFPALANQLAPTNKPFIFSDYGVMFDWHNILVQGEYTVATASDYTTHSKGRYLTAGYRIRKFTPYINYAQRNPFNRINNPIPRVGPLLALSTAVDSLTASYKQHTTSFGVRWDFHDSMDLKLQVDHISPTGPGILANVQPGFKGPVNVAALVVDFVF